MIKKLDRAFSKVLKSLSELLHMLRNSPLNPTFSHTYYKKLQDFSSLTNVLYFEPRRS